MSEPPEVADHADQVGDGIWHWAVANSRIGGSTSSCHLIEAGDACVLVDPVRLEETALAPLPAPTAIVLTAKCHQRSAWRYRALFSVPVWAPEGAPEADEAPDRTYAEGDPLPAGLQPIRTPGPEPVHYCLHREARPPLVICSDLLMRGDGRELEFVPGEYHDDPEETRRSVERLLDLHFDMLLLDHGPPVLDRPKDAIRRLLSQPT